jgi:hypothetical protein
MFTCLHCTKTPKAFASWNPGLEQPWVKKKDAYQR